MRKGLVVAVALGVALVTAPAGAAPEHTASIQRGETFNWDGAVDTSANPYYFRGVIVVGGLPPETIGPVSSSTCDEQPWHSCDDVLVELSNPLTQQEIDSGLTRKVRSATIELTELEPAPVSDFDFQVFASDEDGTKGPYWTGAANTSQSGNFQVEEPGESLSVPVETTIAQPSRWMLIRVVRFFSPNASYKGTVRF